MDKITKINHEHFNDVAIGILSKYNMYNECKADDIKALTANYYKRYIEVYNQLIEEQSKK